MAKSLRCCFLKFAGLVLLTSVAGASDVAAGPGLIVESVSPQASAQAAPGQTVSGQAVSGQTVSGQAVSGRPQAKDFPLKVNDRLFTYNDKPLRSPAALQAWSENTVGISEVSVQVRRDGQTITLHVPTGPLDIEVRPELAAGVETLYLSGLAAGRAGRSKEQIASWEQAAKGARKDGSAASAAWLYEKVADAQETQRQWKEASGSHLAARELLAGKGDPAAESRTLTALGRCSQRLNDFPAAARWFEQARDVDTSADLQIWVAGDLNNLGNVSRARGNLQVAKGNYDRALAMLERLAPNSKAVAASLNNLGVIGGMSGDLPLAEDYFRRALEIRERVAPDSLDVASSLNDLGIVARSRGDLQAARAYHEKTLAIRERLVPDSLEVAWSLDNLGLVAQDQGDLEAAQRYHSRALAMFEELAPNSLDVAASYNNLGLVARARGDFQAAQEYHRRDFEISQTLAPDSLETATSLNNLGLVALDRGNIKAAQEYHLRALAIFQRLAPNSLDVASSLQNLGLVAMTKGQFDTARDYYSRGLKIFQQQAPDTLMVASSFYNLGEIARKNGDPETARKQYEQASAIFERLASNSLNFAGNLSGLGSLALADGKFAEAQSLFARAVAIVENQRVGIYSSEGRALLVAQHTQVYAGLLRAYLGLNDVRSAFAVSERARARSLLDLLAEAHTDIRSGIDPALLQRERSLQQLLNGKAVRQTELLSDTHTAAEAAASAREIEGIAIQYDRVQAEIRASSPHYAALTQPQPSNSDETQREVLDPDTVLLEYALGDDASHLFVLTQTDIKIYPLPSRAKIEVAASQAYDRLTARNQHKNGETQEQRKARVARADAAYPEAAARLSRMLIAPAAADLGKKRLLIVAGGGLLRIPFGALPDPASGGSKPLIVSHEVVTAPSASVLAAQRRDALRRTPPDQELAIFADPVFERDDPRVTKPLSPLSKDQPVGKPANTFAANPIGKSAVALKRVAGDADLLDGINMDGVKIRRLAFSREEADGIYALAPRGKAFKALDFDASRAVAASPELRRYRIVHFATHALVNEKHPQLSGIVLSLVDRKGQPIDGFLRLNEIYNLNLPADLVVLSACQTGLGKEIQGEGLIGLMRGFMYAGASGVVASLWKVDDEATAELMTSFYEQMLKRGQPVGASLRKAQLAMAQRPRWQAPYFWAGFALQGEWK